MRGIIFREFLEMVENLDGFAMVDAILETSNVRSGGAYTTVGTYDHSEFVSIVNSYTALKRSSVETTLREFGTHLFGRLVVLYPKFFENRTTTFEFLTRVESHIHFEVRKLYPDAELPTFRHIRPDTNRLELIYESPRHLPDFAEGLIQGCVAYFGERITVERQPVDNAGARQVRFVLTCEEDMGHERE